MAIAEHLVRKILPAAVAGLLSLAWGTVALAQARIDDEAERVMRAMSSYLGGLESFSADYDVDLEHLTYEGEKLQFSAGGQISVSRPDKARMVRHGGFADIELTYDGKQISILGKLTKSYAQVSVPGTLANAINFLRTDLDLEIPGGDLLLPNIYDALMVDVKSGAYWGTTHVGGIDCHYLAFRGADVDWQIWISTGDKPLPIKMVITSKWMAGAPQYALRLSNWKTGVQFPAAFFDFKPPADARKLEAVSAEMLGEQPQRK